MSDVVLNKKKYISKYYPISILIPSVLLYSENIETLGEVSSSIEVLDEGSEIEVLLELILISPMVPDLIKEKAEQYITTRAAYDGYLNTSISSICSNLKNTKDT